MHAKQLKLTLENLDSSDWSAFERFASQFMASELPDYRNMAATYGDKGRDGEVYSVGRRASVLYQMSVTPAWETKITSTTRRLRQNFKEIETLVYVTNVSIGPAADELKWTLAEGNGIDLDIRDASWFIDRCNTNSQRERACEDLADIVLGSMYRSSSVKSRIARPLTDEEARVGLLHLALDASDDATQKGLTKSCFESLVLAALHDTDSDARITEYEILTRVRSMLPAGPRDQISMYAANALARLSKKRGRIKFWTKTQDYCLSNEEVSALKLHISDFIECDQHVERELAKKLVIYVDRLDESQVRLSDVALVAKEGLEEALLATGEAFASAVAGGEVASVNADQIRSILSHRTDACLRGLKYQQIAEGTCAFIASADDTTSHHLRRLADAYTLFAFLRQTPDVQKAVVKIFSQGDIWLDTSIILPLVTESLELESANQKHTNLLRAARSVGLRLFVTTGVLEEVDKHLANAMNCAKSMASTWRSRVPFVYSEYVRYGADSARFSSWVSDFRGSIRPLDDLLEFLNEEFGVELLDLHEEVDRAPADLKAAATEFWHSVHERRRNRRDSNQLPVNPETVRKLVQHDVECTVGIIVRRTGSPISPLGYKEWWLCLDRASSAFTDKVRQLCDWQGHSPILRPDFLAEYLRIGPLRSALDEGQRVTVPVLADVAKRPMLSPELVLVANKVRQGHSGMSERSIRREVRDTLDKSRIFANVDDNNGSLAELDQEFTSVPGSIG